MEQEQELFGKLFNSIPLYNESHLDAILDSMDKDQSIYYLIQAVSHAYHSGVYTIGESEIISKAIRTVTKKEEEKEKETE
jgi:hypothetical protein